MSTNRYPPPPRDTLRTKTKDLGFFIACVLALALFMATPLAGSQIPSAKAQIAEENNRPQAQGPAASINATQTGTVVCHCRSRDKWNNCTECRIAKLQPDSSGNSSS